MFISQENKNLLFTLQKHNLHKIFRPKSIIPSIYVRSALDTLSVKKFSNRYAFFDEGEEKGLKQIFFRKEIFIRNKYLFFANNFESFYSYLDEALLLFNNILKEEYIVHPKFLTLYPIIQNKDDFIESYELIFLEKAVYVNKLNKKIGRYIKKSLLNNKKTNFEIYQDYLKDQTLIIHNRIDTFPLIRKKNPYEQRYIHYISLSLMFSVIVDDLI
ncbi:MAG: hypothetical protein QXX30_00285 [Candidatus Aenigmatarchaeota archaeon]